MFGSKKKHILADVWQLFFMLTKLIKSGRKICFRPIVH